MSKHQSLTGDLSSPAHEQHYTVQEVAKLWAWSVDTVRRVFADEPGVLKHSHARVSGRGRPHVMLSIPASVLERLHEQRSAGFGLKIQSRGGRV